MATVVPMGISLVNPARMFGGDVNAFRKQAADADHMSNVRDSQSQADAFVVTPEGQALPGVQELHVDADGSLRIVDRVPRQPNFDPEKPLPTRSPTTNKLPQIPNGPFYSPAKPSPMIKWSNRPSITWNKPFESQEPKKERKTVQIFVVAEDGTTEIQEIAMREFQRRQADAEQFRYVVEEGGAVHRAHCVFIGGPEAEVVLRSDEEEGAPVYDKIRTPQPTLTPFSDIVFITDENGCTHTGTTVMVADKDGNSTVLNRVATWPALFVTNTTKKPMYLAYTAPRQLDWKKGQEPDKSTGDCFVVEHPGGVFETYNRILLAANESVFLAYRSSADADAIIVSEGKMLRAGCLIKKPTFEKDMTPIIVTGGDGVSHYGVNVFVSSPNGFIPVGRVASVSKKTQRETFQEGLQHDDEALPMLVGWPQRLCILNEPHKTTTCATKTLEDKLATKLVGKIPPTEPLPLPTKRTLTPVIIGTTDTPGTVSYLPPPDSWAGVLLSGDGPLKLGHSVINMGTDPSESSVTYAVDEEQ